MSKSTISFLIGRVVTAPESGSEAADGGLTSRTQYSYRVTAWNDCNGNGSFDAGVDTESATSNLASATAQ